MLSELQETGKGPSEQEEAPKQRLRGSEQGEDPEDKKDSH